jgi:hypothetical protein
MPAEVGLLRSARSNVAYPSLLLLGRGEPGPARLDLRYATAATPAGDASKPHTCSSAPGRRLK